MGSQLELVDVVWDTGSDWLIVASADCDTCDGKKYDSGKDLTYTPVSPREKTIYYGDGMATGLVSSADVCV